MNCHYYVKSTLVIEYIDKITSYISIISTDIKINKGYIYYTDDYDSDDDEETIAEKIDLEIEKKIKLNTFNKMLYENSSWIKESYRKKYEGYLLREFPEISRFLKIYKKVTASKRN